MQTYKLYLKRNSVALKSLISLVIDKGKTILQEHGLKVTSSRLEVLDHFFSNNHALSHQDLESETNSIDRVTLYRTLNSFEEKGITHKVLDQNGVAKFALCKSECTEHHHHDNHFHFHCTSCSKTYCLDDSLKQEIKLPKGFKMNDVRLNVRGTCDSCI